MDDCETCSASVIVVTVEFRCSNCEAYGRNNGCFHGPEVDESPADAMRRNAHLN